MPTKRARAAEGFTLIELMVVVLIIAILIAIAIPTFLGARRRAQERSAQSSLRNALTAAKTVFTDTQDYANVTASALASTEPSLDFVDGTTASGGANQISVSNSTGQIVLTNKSASGTCFQVTQSADAAAVFTSSGSATCSSATAITGGTWGG